MPIVNLQRFAGLTKLGKLRMGYSEPGKNGGKSPKRSETWIISSGKRELLEVAAKIWGGTVQDWPDGDGFRLFTTVKEIKVYVTPFEPVQWYEKWDGGECVRRCDGQTCQTPYYNKGRRLWKSGPCPCSEESRDCKITTRSQFILPDIPELGLFTFESHGYYYAVELPTMQDFVRVAGQLVTEAFLCIEQRSVRRDGQTRIFPVAVLRAGTRPTHLALGAGSDAGVKALETQAAALMARNVINPELIEPYTTLEFAETCKEAGVTSPALLAYLGTLVAPSLDRLEKALAALSVATSGNPADVQEKVNEAKKAGVHTWDDFTDWVADNGGVRE